MMCRFLHDAAAMLLWGGYGFLSLLVPASLASGTARALNKAAIMAAAATFLASIAELPLETATIGIGWQDAVNVDTISAVLFDTSIGQAWLVDALASAMLFVCVLPNRFPGRAAAITAASGLVLSSLVMTGHAMMREGWVGYIQQINDLVHVLAAGAWLGALVPLLVILRGLAKASVFHDHEQALKRFSKAGKVAVALILCTGLINTLLIVGHWPIDITSSYQLMLDAKIVVVLCMIGIAGRNQFVLVPKLRRDRALTSAAIRNAAIGEIALGTVAIALVSIFGILDPQ